MVPQASDYEPYAIFTEDYHRHSQK